MRRPRFKLIVIFIVVTALALPLGWLQYRRLDLKHELSKLKSDGCTVSFQDNGLWLTAPQVRVKMRKSSEGQLSIGDGDVSPDEASDRIYEMQDQFRKLDVDDKTILLETSDEKTGKDFTVTMYVDDFEPPRMTFAP